MKAKAKELQRMEQEQQRFVLFLLSKAVATDFPKGPDPAIALEIDISGSNVYL